MRDYAEFAASLEWPEFRWLFDYWNCKCRGADLPSRSEVHPSDLVGLLPRIFMIDVMRGPCELDFKFRLAGTEHHAINGKEITGLLIEEAFAPEYVAGLRAVYQQVTQTRLPHVARSFAAIDGRQHVKYDRLLLPLASDGQTVDVLLGYLHPITAERTFPRTLSGSLVRTRKFNSWDVGDRRGRLALVTEQAPKR